MKNTLILILAYCFACGHLAAQEHFVFSPINSNNGLSENRVRSLCQLSDGRMVIITEGLVNIYDGSYFRYLHFNDQKAYFLAKYSGFHHAYVDGDDHLWIKNHHKLMLFDVRSEVYVPNIDSVLANQGMKSHLADLFMDSGQNFWYITETDELIYRDAKEKRASLFITNVSRVNGQNDQVYDIATCEKLLFIFYKSGLMICYDTGTHKELYRENPLSGSKKNFSNTLMVVPYKNYLYQVRNGSSGGLLLRFNSKERKWDQVLETDYWLNTLTIDNKGNSWVSSLKGLWLIDEALQNKRYIPQLQLVDGRIFETEISTQYNDNKGGLWIGTVNRGLLYYHPDRFKFRYFGRLLFKLANHDDLTVSCFAEINGDILVGTQSGLFHYSKHTQSLVPYPGTPLNMQCNALLKDSKQRIWVCSGNNGLYCINNSNVKHYSFPFNSFNLLETFDGQFYLSTNNGLGIFDPLTGSYSRIETPSDHNISSVFQLINYKQDTLIGISNNGLFIYSTRNRAFSFPGDEKKWILRHSNHQYNCLYADSRGWVWFGTQDGLNVYNVNNCVSKSFFEEDGLVNNNIRSVMEDSYGRIWISTSSGISRIDIARKNGAYQYSFANFNKFDGVIENEFMPRSAYKTTDNHLLWGGLDGFNEIDLSCIDSSRQQLSVPLFTRFFLSGTEIRQGEKYNGNVILKQSISSTREINLKHFQNFFSFEFSALNYTNPTQTYYRYQLQGVDAAWHEIRTTDGMGRAIYTNLPSGTYRLQVLAANNNRQWDNRYAEMTIIIHPPLWKTPLAYILYILLLLGVLYLSLSYYVRRNRHKMQKKQKEELDQLKFSFFTNISHELRTPLTLILTPLDAIIKKTDEPLKTKLTGIYRNANDLLKLVNQLLDFRKLEMKGETLQLSYCNIGEFLETITSSFKELAVDKEIEFSFECRENDLNVYIDKDKLHKIVNNLLSNAFKFTSKGGRVLLILRKSSVAPMFQILVTDTGCGIPAHELPMIFDRFYQVKDHDSLTGSGIGLHLVKEYVQLHNGTVEVESAIDKGSTFMINIPATLHSNNESLFVTGKEQDSALKLLVVEDNVEFRTFLYNELSEKYQVLVASNGREGLEKAKEHHPDLVITDVMMPEMSGTELCRSLKNDLQVSHIPVILLTAKASNEAQVEGFEAGADAYVTKPFNMDILLLRIHNLMEQQKQRKNLFKKAIVINASSLTSSNIDEELIKKALGYIEKNMDNVSYSVEQLSKDMCMDRTGLYRKLTAIVGQTPTEFMRSVRLKKAAQLLGNGLPISEVSESVGFGTTSYFTKCFQEEFGVKPSQYKNKV